MNAPSPPSAPDSGAVALSWALQLLGLPVEPAHLMARAGKDAPDEADLLRAVRDWPVKVRAIDSTPVRLSAMAQSLFPVLAQMGDGGWVLIGGINANGADGRVLVQDPRDGLPRTVPLDDFAAGWSGRLILVARRASLVDPHRRFGIGWFVGAVAKYRRPLGEVFVASFFLQVFALLTPIFFQVVIDKVFVHRGLSTLEVLAVGLAAISIFDTVLGTLRTYLFAHTSNRIDVELGARLFRHLFTLPLGYFQARRVGDTVARVRELDNIRQFLTSSAITLALDLFFALVFLAVLALYSWQLTIVVAAALPLYVVLSLAVTPLFRARLDERFRRGAENQSFLVEAVSGAETIKSMAVEPRMQARWEDQIAAYVGSSFAVSRLANVASQTAGLINKITVVLILFIGARLVVAERLTVGELVAFNMISGQLAAPVLRLAQLWQDFQQARISIDRLGDILNAQPEPGTSAPASLPPLKGAISLQNVSFRYRPDAPPVLREVSLDIPAGQVIGVVGASGSGKSTFAKLVQRLYVPEAGRISVDGIDLGQTDPAWLRRQIGVVLQENVLFNRPVRENIALREPAAAMARVVAAAELAGAHEFIAALPEGYDTVLGERGASLSGGQRQRIAIARALIGEPRILILDEATSALDYESEAAIQANMRRICAGRTVLIIAHRLSTLRDADRIVTMEAGQIIEDGTHADLLRAGGRYARLWALQNGEGRA